MKKSKYIIITSIFVLLVLGCKQPNSDNITSTDVFKWTIKDNKVTINGFSDKGVENLLIPQSIDGLPVVALGEEAFMNNQIIKSVKFAENSKVEKIGDYCFTNVSNANSLVLPPSLVEIGKFAFSNFGTNNKIKDTLLIPGNVKLIGENAFNYADQYNVGLIGEVQLDKKITSLPSNLFSGAAFTKFVIPRNINLEEGPLNQSRITELYIPKKLASLKKTDDEYDCYFSTANEVSATYYFEGTEEEVKKYYGEDYGIYSGHDGDITMKFSQTMPSN